MLDGGGGGGCSWSSADGSAASIMELRTLAATCGRSIGVGDDKEADVSVLHPSRARHDSGIRNSARASIVFWCGVLCLSSESAIALSNKVHGRAGWLRVSRP